MTRNSTKKSRKLYNKDNLKNSIRNYPPLLRSSSTLLSLEVDWIFLLESNWNYTGNSDLLLTRGVYTWDPNSHVVTLHEKFFSVQGAA